MQYKFFLDERNKQGNWSIFASNEAKGTVTVGYFNEHEEEDTWYFPPDILYLPYVLNVYTDEGDTNPKIIAYKLPDDWHEQIKHTSILNLISLSGG